MAEYRVWWKEKSVRLAAVLLVLFLVGTNLLSYHLGLTKAPPRDPPVGDCDLAEPESLGQEWNIFVEVLERLQESYLYPVDLPVLIRGAAIGAVKAVDDPRTAFYDARELEDLLIQTQGSFSGIGVRIIEVDDEVVVFETIPGSPAEAVGILPGDRICRAGNLELSGLGLERAAEILRGDKGSSIALSIRRPGRDDELNVTLLRDEVKVETVSAHWERPGLGYLRISNFDSNTGDSFSEKLHFLESGGLEKGLLLDLRNNPGGQVDEAVKVAGLIVPEGEITRLVGRNDEVRNIYHSAAPKKDYPIVVLVNEDTASAAEILAGALQDREAALLVGVKTYGKATVQRLETLSGGSALLLTVAHYLTPAGRDIDGLGLEPDVVVEMPPSLKYYRYFFPGPLAKGDSGAHVQVLQEMLAELGYEPGSGGYFDEATAEALRSFQISAGLKGSGNFDEMTWVRLREAFEKIAPERDLQLLRAIELIEQPEIWSVRGGISSWVR